MHNKRVIYPNDDGGVSIIVPAPGVTEEQVLLAVPKGIDIGPTDVAVVFSRALDVQLIQIQMV